MICNTNIIPKEPLNDNATKNALNTETLPIEMHYEIYKYLNSNDMINFMLVNKNIKAIMGRDIIIKKREKEINLAEQYIEYFLIKCGLFEVSSPKNKCTQLAKLDKEKLLFNILTNEKAVNMFCKKNSFFRDAYQRNANLGEKSFTKKKCYEVIESKCLNTTRIESILSEFEFEANYYHLRSFNHYAQWHYQPFRVFILLSS